MKKYLFTAFLATAFLPQLIWAEEATTTPPESAPQEQAETPAPEPVTLTLRVNAHGTDLFNGSITVSPCAYEETSTSTSFNALCALKTGLTDANIPYSAPWSDFGYFVDEIGGYASDHSRYVYWTLFKGDAPAEQGIALTAIADGDEILLTYDTSIMRVSASPLTPSTNSTTTLTAQYFDLSAWPWEWKTAADSVFVINGIEASSTAGVHEIFATTTESLAVHVKKDGLIQSDTVTITPQGATPVEEPSPESSGSSGGSGGGGETPHAVIFDTSKAALFLISKQNESGAIGSGFYSDWAAIGLSSISSSDSVKEKLASYIQSSSVDSSLTDHERRAMALLSLGKDPRENGHIQAILAKFDGTQFGDENLVNDDIFAIYPLIASGYGESDTEIVKTVAFIISKQSEDGSWEGSVDVTSAAIQALALTPALSTGDALSKARAFLAQSQGSDACFGNTSSTAWALQAIASLNETPDAWSKGTKTPKDCIGSAQAPDGGVDVSQDENSRIWATAYSLPAYQGETWNALFTRFSKPSGGSSGGSAANVAENPIATSTATATPAIPPAETAEEDAREATLAYIEKFTGLPGSTVIYLNDPAPTEKAKSPTESVELIPEKTPTNTASVLDSAKSVQRSTEPVRETVSRGIKIITRKLLSIFK